MIHTNSVFVETATYRKVVDLLQAGRSVQLFGAFGSGKTTCCEQARASLEQPGLLTVTYKNCGVVDESVERHPKWLNSEVLHPLLNELLGKLGAAEVAADAVSHASFRTLLREALAASPQRMIVALDEVQSLFWARPKGRQPDLFLRELTELLKELPPGKLVLCLLAAPQPLFDRSTLDWQSTVYDIGETVLACDFSEEELSRLVECHPSLPRMTEQAQKFLARELFSWTEGHPRMVERLLAAIAEMPHAGALPACLDDLVERLFPSISGGKDKLVEQYGNVYFATERLDERQMYQLEQMLELYRCILDKRLVAFLPDNQVHADLLLTGLVRQHSAARETWLGPRNRILEASYSPRWAEDRWRTLKLARQARAWDGSRSQLLTGDELQADSAWVQRQGSEVNVQILQFVRASEVAQQEAQDAERSQVAHSQARRFGRLRIVAFALLVVGFIALGFVVYFAWRDRAWRLRDRDARLSEERLANKAARYVNRPGYEEDALLAALNALDTGRRAHGKPDPETEAVLSAAVDLGRQSIPIHHRGGVQQVLFSPSGDVLLSISNIEGQPGQSAQLWSPKDGAPLGSPMVHQNYVYQAAFAAHGELIATASAEPDGGSIYLWNHQGQQVKRLRHRLRYPFRLAFDSTGDRLLVAEGGASRAAFYAELWDSKSGRLLAELRESDEPTGGYADAAFLHGGQIVMAGNRGFTLWDRDGARVASLREEAPNGSGATLVALHDKPQFLFAYRGTLRKFDAEGRLLASLGDVTPWAPIAVSPDESWMVIGDLRGKITIRSLLTGAVLREIAAHDEAVVGIALSPRADRLVSAGQDGLGYVWDVRTGQRLDVLQGHGASITSIAFSPDGARIATASSDRDVRLWHGERGLYRNVLRGHPRGATIALFSPDGQRVLTAGRDSLPRLWDGVSGRGVGVLIAHQSEVFQAAFSPASRWLATMDESGKACQWDTRDGKPVACWEYPAAILDGLFSPDDSLLALGRRDGHLSVRSVADGSIRWERRAHESGVRNVSFPQDGRLLLTSSPDGTAKLWDAASGDEAATLVHSRAEGIRKAVRVSLFSPDGRLILTAGNDRRAVLWSRESRQMIFESSHPEEIWAGAISPDSRHFAVGTLGHVQIVDVLRKTPPLGLAAGAKMTTCLAFSPDGKRLAGSSYDGSVRIWDAESGALLGQGTGHRQEVEMVSFSPDGKRLLSAGGDGSARLWDGVTAKAWQPSDDSGDLLSPMQVVDTTQEHRWPWQVAKDWACRLLAFQPTFRQVATLCDGR